MHESVIAAEIIRKIREISFGAGAGRVLSATVRMGLYSGVVPEALDFAFEQLRGKDILENCQLRIEMIPSAFVCWVCETRFEVFETSGNNHCPNCGGVGRMVGSSQELTLAKIEIED